MKTDAAERRTDDEPKRGGLNPRVIYHAVARHPILLLLVVFLAGAAAAGVWLFLPLPKKSAAVVYRVAVQPHALLAPTAESRIDFTSYKNTQMALVKSRRTLAVALDPIRNPAVGDLQMVRTARPDIKSWLDRYLTVDSRGQSEFVRVTLEGDDEAELLVLLGAIDKAYLAAAYDLDNGARNRRQDDLEKTLAKAREELVVLQDGVSRIARILGAKDDVSLTLIGSDLRTDLSQERRRGQTLKDDLRLAQKQLETAQEEAWRAAVRRAAPAWFKDWVAAVLPRPATRQPFVPLSAIEAELERDPAFQELEKVATRARQDLVLTEDRFQKEEAPNQPAVVRAREALKAAEEAVEKYREPFVERFRAKVRERQVQIEESWPVVAQDECDRLQGQLSRSGEREAALANHLDEHLARRAELTGLKSTIERKEKFAAEMADEIERLKIEVRAPARVSVAEEAFVVPGIEGNRRLKFALLAAVGLFAAGFGGLVFWEVRCRRVTHPGEVTDGAGARLLGTIPPLAAGGPAEVGGDDLVEAIDTARVMITHGTPGGHDLRVLLVTSAVAGEGKTTLSGHLAISLARAGFRTLLVDGDLLSPTAHSTFGVTDTPGLCDLLRGEAEAAAAVRTSPIPGLSVLPAGHWTVATRQALSGERWRTLAGELKAGFDFVVIDTSPLLLVSDALLLAREADGVVISVLLGVSQIVRVQETIDKLRAVDAEVVGVIVNNVRNDVYHQYAHYSGRYRSPAVLSAGAEPARTPAAGAVEA